MRIRNFLIAVGFGVVAALVLVLLNQIPFAILFFVAQLVIAIIMDIKKVRGQKKQEAFREKYPDVPRQDTTLAAGDNTVTLSDAAIKSALKNTICPVAYENRKGDFLERFYKAVMSGEYTVEAMEILKKEFEPGNDSSDVYDLVCGNGRFSVSQRECGQCRVGDTLATVTVAGCAFVSVAFLLDPEDREHRVVHQNELY